MTHIHWLGAGLSSLPGIRRMASGKHKLTVWNRTLAKAEFSINHIQSDDIKAKQLNLIELSSFVISNLQNCLSNFLNFYLLLTDYH